MKRTLLISWLLAGLTFAQARTWTSADGTKTFEGELKSFDAGSGKVSVTINGRQKTFSIDKLSEKDVEFLKEWEKEASKPSVEEALQEQKIGKELTSKILSRIDGKKFKKVSMEKAPEYYLLYFSASW